MSGVVVELRIHVGSHVKKGDPIAVLSAMKMEMVISAPHAGKIDQIKVTEGVPRPACLIRANISQIGLGYFTGFDR